jgi:hypothetical protein
MCTRILLWHVATQFEACYGCNGMQVYIVTICHRSSQLTSIAQCQYQLAAVQLLCHARQSSYLAAQACTTVLRVSVCVLKACFLLYVSECGHAYITLVISMPTLQSLSLQRLTSTIICI